MPAKKKLKLRKIEPLRKYQKRAVEFLTDRYVGGVFLRPGLGKTRCSLEAFDVLRRRKEVSKVLVISTLRPMLNVWPSEIEKWGFDYAVATLYGRYKEEALQSDADVYLTTYENLEWIASRILGGDAPVFDLLVLDESSKIKNTNTKRFKMLKLILTKFAHRYILTGSPASNGLINLFGQAYALDQGYALGRYVTHFRNKYFYPSGYMGYTWKIKPDGEKEIYARLKDLVLRLPDSVLKLPPLTTIDIKVTLPPDARKVYAELERHFITELQGATVTAANAAALTSKLRQVSNGGIYVESDVAKHVHDAKTEALAELVAGLEGSPLLVAYEFKHDLSRIKKAFPKAVDMSKVKEKDLNAVVKAWNNGEIEMMVGHPGSIAHGLNLQESGFSVAWYGLTYNLEYYEQLIHRVWRSGQKNPVFNYRFVAENTIDEVVVAALETKGKVQNALLKALERRYL